MFKRNFMLRLAKSLMSFGEVATNKGKLTYEGELVEGTEVFIETDEELVPAEDGEYEADGKIYVVAGGKIVEIREIEPEEPTEEPKEETPAELEETPEEVDPRIAELEARIAELEAILAERDARIAELEAQLAEKEEQLQMSVAKPAHKEVKDIIVTNKENKALKYFQK